MPETRDWVEDVLDFHRAFCPDLIGTTPAFPPVATCHLRFHLMIEEWNELVRAHDDEDLSGVAREIVDLIYVLIGKAVTYGIDLRPVWTEVQKANMAKAGGDRRADGKVTKPPGWEPPDVAGVLAVQGPLDAGR